MQKGINPRSRHDLSEWYPNDKVRANKPTELGWLACIAEYGGAWPEVCYVTCLGLFPRVFKLQLPSERL